MICTLLLSSSNERSWTLFFRLLLWAPQLAWGLLAIWLLIRTLAGVHRAGQPGRKLWHRGRLLVPYAMILGAIGFQVYVFELPPFANPLEPSGPPYAIFWETVVPSVAILVILVLVHVLIPLFREDNKDLGGNSPK